MGSHRLPGRPDRPSSPDAPVPEQPARRRLASAFDAISSVPDELAAVVLPVDDATSDHLPAVIAPAATASAVPGESARSHAAAPSPRPKRPLPAWVTAPPVPMASDAASPSLPAAPVSPVVAPGAAVPRTVRPEATGNGTPDPSNVHGALPHDPAAHRADPSLTGHGAAHDEREPTDGLEGRRTPATPALDPNATAPDFPPQAGTLPPAPTSPTVDTTPVMRQPDGSVAVPPAGSWFTPPPVVAADAVAAEQDAQQGAMPDGALPGAARPDGALPGIARPDGGASPSAASIQRPHDSTAIAPHTAPHTGGQPFAGGQPSADRSTPPAPGRAAPLVHDATTVAQAAQFAQAEHERRALLDPHAGQPRFSVPGLEHLIVPGSETPGAGQAAAQVAPAAHWTAPQQPASAPSIPQRSTPPQFVPQQSVPQQSVPQQSVPQPSVPQQAAVGHSGVRSQGQQPSIPQPQTQPQPQPQSVPLQQPLARQLPQPSVPQPPVQEPSFAQVVFPQQTAGDQPLSSASSSTGVAGVTDPVSATAAAARADHAVQGGTSVGGDPSLQTETAPGAPGSRTSSGARRTSKAAARRAAAAERRTTAPTATRASKPARSSAEPGAPARPVIAPSTAAFLAAVLGVVVLALGALGVLSGGQVHAAGVVVGVLAILLATLVLRGGTASTWRLIALVGLVLGVVGTALTLYEVAVVAGPAIGIHVPAIPGGPGLTGLGL